MVVVVLLLLLSGGRVGGRHEAEPRVWAREEVDRDGGMPMGRKDLLGRRRRRQPRA